MTDRSEMPMLPTLQLGNEPKKLSGNILLQDIFDGQFCSYFGAVACALMCFILCGPSGRAEGINSTCPTWLTWPTCPRFISHGIGPMPLLLDEQHPFTRCLAEIPLRLQLDENRVSRNERNTSYQ